MSDAFKDVSTVPTLTLEPFQAEEEKKPAASKAKKTTAKPSAKSRAKTTKETK